MISIPHSKSIATFLTNKKLILPILLLLIVIMNILALNHKRLTYDEGRHYDYGTQILEGNSNRFDDSKMPFSALNAAPKKLWESIENQSWSRPLRTLRKMRTGRYATVLFSVLVGFFVFRWAKELYGETAGYWALTFYIFAPNILAHSRLITTDLYATGMILISLYYFWKLLNHFSWKNAWWSAFTLGLSQLAKYSCIFLYPLFLLIAAVFYYVKHREQNKKKKMVIFGSETKKTLLTVLFICFVSIMVINVGYLFNRTMTPFEDYKFKSRIFNQLQDDHSVLSKLPVPVPAPYLEGLDWVKYNEESGEGFGLLYLMGETKRGEGFKGYYFYASLYKIPIAILLFTLIAMIHYINQTKKYLFFKNELFLILPILFFTVYFNFIFKAHMGMRYFIVIIPLLHIFCSSLFKGWGQLKNKVKNLYVLLLIYYILSVMSYTPHYLSYFNEFIGDRKQSYKILADSNLDWGENEWYLNKYKEKHPEVIVNPTQPTKGRIVVNINQLTGVTDGPEKYAWLRNHFEPIDHIAYSYLVYEVLELPT